MFLLLSLSPKVVAGQGTVAMELLEQNPYMDAVVVPVGGGGLIAGMALLLKAVNPRVKIYGVESSAMPGMHASVRAGKLQSVKKRPTMADGIAIEHVGAIAFDIIRDCVDEIVLVDEDEVAQAVLLMLEKEKTVTEGSGAAGLAALLSGKLPQVKDQNVVCVVTGSNIDMSLLSRIIEKGLVMTGRMARVHVTVLDVPGQLAKSVRRQGGCADLRGARRATGAAVDVSLRLLIVCACLTFCFVFFVRVRVRVFPECWPSFVIFAPT